MIRYVKIIAFVLIIIPLTFTSCNDSKRKNNNDYSVYICDGPFAKRYHKHRNCSGLDNCSGSVFSSTHEEAEKQGLTKCQICY